MEEFLFPFPWKQCPMPPRSKSQSIVTSIWYLHPLPTQSPDRFFLSLNYSTQQYLGQIFELAKYNFVSRILRVAYPRTMTHEGNEGVCTFLHFSPCMATKRWSLQWEWGGTTISSWWHSNMVANSQTATATATTVQGQQLNTKANLIGSSNWRPNHDALMLFCG